MNLERLYLDYNATSPLSHSVSDWLKSGEVLFANPSSQHSSGKASRKVINEARAFLFSTFKQNEKETKLFFHSGATEAIHTCAYSFSEMARLKGFDLLICYSKMDHPAVTSLSEKYLGSHVKFLELERNQDLHYDHQKNFEIIKDKKENNPDLIILYHHLWVHNETGQVAPLGELSPFKKIPDLYLHVDAVQAPGKIAHWQNLAHGDVWSFSAHKFGSLKGVGFTFFKSSIPFHGFILGGGQQNNLRSGTENPMAIKTVHLALKDLLKVNVENNQSFRDDLIQFLKTELRNKGDVIDDLNTASNTIYFYLHHHSSDIALALFDQHGLEISAGSACSSGAAKDSAVMLQKGLTQFAKNGLRLSFGFSTDDSLIAEIKNRLKDIFRKI